jgi:hypothetical protein
MMNRRDLLKTGLIGAAATMAVSVPNIYNSHVPKIIDFTGPEFNGKVFDKLVASYDGGGELACFMSFDLWSDILSDADMTFDFEPVTKHQVVMEGLLGKYKNVTMYTDGFRETDEYVTKPGEFYLARASTVQKLKDRTDRSDFMRIIKGEGAIKWTRVGAADYRA